MRKDLPRGRFTGQVGMALSQPQVAMNEVAWLIGRCSPATPQIFPEGVLYYPLLIELRDIFGNHI